MFDTFNGLPLHPLVVHGVVVLLPLMCVLTAVVAARPALHRFALPVVGANVVVFLLTFVAKESGEKLEWRVEAAGAPSTLEAHTELGDLMPIAALALLVAGLVVWFAATRNPKLAPIATGLAVVVGLGVLGLTFAVGESGARAVWESLIQTGKS